MASESPESPLVGGRGICAADVWRPLYSLTPGIGRKYSVLYSFKRAVCDPVPGTCPPVPPHTHALTHAWGLGEGRQR